MQEISVQEVFDILLSAQPGLYDEFIFTVKKCSDATTAYKLLGGCAVKFRIDGRTICLACDTGSLDMEDINMLAKVYTGHCIPVYTMHAEKLPPVGNGYYIFVGNGTPCSDKRVAAVDRGSYASVAEFISDYRGEEAVLPEDDAAVFAVYDGDVIIGTAVAVLLEEKLVSLNIFVSDECVEKGLDVCLVRSAMAAYPDALCSVYAHFSDEDGTGVDNACGAAERAGLRLAGMMFATDRHMSWEMRPDDIPIP